MSGWELAALLAGAVAGGFVNGLAGFGTALFALGFWLQIMPPQEAVAISVILSIVSGAPGLWEVRRHISEHRRRFLRFAVPAFIGVPIGAAILAVVSAAAIKLIIATFLILYGAFFLVRRSLPRFTRPTPVLDGVVGLAGGVLGGAASLSGALPSMWCALRPWPKAEQRALLQPFNVSVLGLTAIALALHGVYGQAVMYRLVFALPAALIAAQIGMIVYRKLSDDAFRVLMIGLMFMSGLILLTRELFAIAATLP